MTSLVQRQIDLAHLTIIPDIQVHAADWLQLAQEYYSLGFFDSWLICYENYGRYKVLPPGRYFREKRGPFLYLYTDEDIPPMWPPIIPPPGPFS